LSRLRRTARSNKDFQVVAKGPFRPVGPEQDHERTPIPRTKPMGRSKITNGTKMLAGVDGRSHIARRLRDIVNGLLIEFPVTSEADLAVVKNTATLTVLNEQLQAKLALGENLDITTITNLAGQLRRNLTDLRSRTDQRGPPPSSIHRG
jgi:hypothetical protein